MSPTRASWLAATIVVLWCGVAARAQEKPKEKEAAPADAEPRLDRIDLRDLALEDACRLLSDQTGLNFVPSTEAASRRVSLFLSDVPVMAAVEALCRAHELWFQRDPRSGIVRISTVKEYSLTSFQIERTEYFTLLYPNAVDVGHAIRNLFGTRAVMNNADGDRESLTELSARLNRFDLLASRTQGLGNRAGGQATGGGPGTGSSALGGGFFGGGDVSTQGLLGPQAQQAQAPPAAPGQAARPDLSASEILELARGDDAQRAAIVEGLARRQGAPIYVTVARRQNRLIVRTGDENALAEIKTLVRKLDVPTPLVLLEVRVLSVDILDGNSSFFEYQWARTHTAGSLLEQLGSNIANPVPPALGPAGAGLRAGDLVFQFIDNRFSARMQLLQQKNRVKTLATPILLTANNEVSRLFVGREVPLNRSFTGGQVVANQASSITTPGTTGIEFRPVGTTLLITPNINADRTVTLRIVQESSSVSSTETVLVPTGSGFTPQTVNVVTSQSVSGTIVAKSDLAVAFGGLIETGTSVERDQVPILGDLPIFGILFRRKNIERETRREVVIVVRPYVLSTPSEAEASSQRLLDKLGVDTQRLDVPVSPADAAERRTGAGFRFHGLDREE